ncbi:MAG: fructosamine kinase family protein, partial [Bacteroidota bacterium]
IATTRTIQTPTIFLCDQYQSTAYLLMEYVEAKRPEKQDFINLGQALAKLHQVTTDQFGWSENNFIGSLPQSNQLYNHWLDFYIEERLMPQFELAQKRQLLSKKEIPTAKILLQKGQHLFQNIQPALLHGDLWSGNYLIDKNGMPYLIDPAAYFGHAEVDLAMTRLFGGFGPAFYNAYYEVNPPQIGESRRRQWYQLYYLLVHLNLFGGQYYQSVVRTLQNL